MRGLSSSDPSAMTWTEGRSLVLDAEEAAAVFAGVATRECGEAGADGLPEHPASHDPPDAPHTAASARTNGLRLLADRLIELSCSTPGRRGGRARRAEGHPLWRTAVAERNDQLHKAPRPRSHLCGGLAPPEWQRSHGRWSRALEATATVLAAVGARAERWPLPEHRGWSLLKPGFERTYRRGRRAWTRARRKGTSEALHEWRKEVKYLLYQLQIVEPAWGASERALARRLDRLADLLGEDHDLAVVRTIVSDPVVDRLISARRTALQRQAFALGGRVYQAPTAARLRSLRSGWKRWHA